MQFDEHANHEVCITQFGKHENHEVPFIQFGEQWKS
jgi:hypothetical protein